MTAAPLGWAGILRLGLVQASLGGIVVLVTSTLNRVLVVEYAVPAILPGLLVALHYAVQMLRPRIGFGSDRSARPTPWIVGGMALLAAGGVLCAIAAVNMASHFKLALALAVLAYALIGLGAGATGTSVLVLLARRVDERRRAAAATLVWVMMIAGFALTSSIAGRFLDPFSPRRLIAVVAAAAALALLVVLGAVWHLEPSGPPQRPSTAAAPGGSFAAALRREWAQPKVRRFTLFVFMSMLAYSAQELLLEPFAGLVFGYSLGQSARLSGLWHGAVLAGMVAVGAALSGRRPLGSLHAWTLGGCCASAAAIASLACAGFVGASWPIRLSALTLGLANGVFAVSAIGSMMQLAHRGEPGEAGVRMGLWGAAQALAFAAGGVLATGLLDAGRSLLGSAVTAFAVVFAAQAACFLFAARFAAHAASARSGYPELDPGRIKEGGRWTAPSVRSM